MGRVKYLTLSLCLSVCVSLCLSESLCLCLSVSVCLSVCLSVSLSPDTTLTTDQKLKEMRIMNLQKQLEYYKGLFMYRLLSSEAPEYISNLYTYTPSRYSSSRNYHLSLPRPRIDIFKTSISFSGAYIYRTTYL